MLGITNRIDDSFTYFEDFLPKHSPGTLYIAAWVLSVLSVTDTEMIKDQRINTQIKWAIYT